MAHLMKFNKASCGHMFAHFDRSAENISNENLDRTKTDLNYNLATHQLMKQGDFVKKRCSEVHCQNRKDVNVMCSWIVTAPKDLPVQEQKQFFQSSYDFMQQRYGKENVISAYVHMDEIQPHLHFAFVPVVYDKKKERYKVSAKEKVTRYDLQTFHSGLENYLEKELGHEINVLNGATKEGNKSIDELRRETAINELKYLKEEKNVLKGQIRSLEGRLLSLKEVEDLDIKKTITGALKGISYDEVVNLKLTALKVTEMNELVDKLEKLNKQANKKIRDLENNLSVTEKKVEKILHDVNRALEKCPKEVADIFVESYKEIGLEQKKQVGKQHGFGLER